MAKHYSADDPEIKEALRGLADDGSSADLVGDPKKFFSAALTVSAIVFVLAFLLSTGSFWQRCVTGIEVGSVSGFIYAFYLTDKKFYGTMWLATIGAIGAISLAYVYRAPLYYCLQMMIVESFDIRFDSNIFVGTTNCVAFLALVFPLLYWTRTVWLTTITKAMLLNGVKFSFVLFLCI